MSDWQELIGFSVLLRQRLNTVDPEPGLSPYTLPGLGASENQIAAAETRLAASLDPVYRDFLHYANGWSDFFTYVDLLGTEDFGQGEPWSKGTELLDLHYSEGPPRRELPPRDEVMVIGVGAHVTDLFVSWRTGPLVDGGRNISWIAGEEVDRYSNFREFFLAVNQYLQNDIKKFDC